MGSLGSQTSKLGPTVFPVSINSLCKKQHLITMWLFRCDTMFWRLDSLRLSHRHETSTINSETDHGDFHELWTHGSLFMECNNTKHCLSFSLCLLVLTRYIYVVEYLDKTLMRWKASFLWNQELNKVKTQYKRGNKTLTYSW